jgi:predicted nucleic acid-binding protein
MIVVSDTTPLRHLIVIGHVGFLPRLYGTVIVPGARFGPNCKPKPHLSWLRIGWPDWLEVRSPLAALVDATALDVLDAGERDAIELASELRADLLLMDDREGRSFALRRQLPVTGTLGVLERADVVGLLSDLPLALAQLEASGFYLSAKLRDSVLARHKSRHEIGS